jgi:polyisoprenoid-binding protein YceI
LTSLKIILMSLVFVIAAAPNSFSATAEYKFTPEHGKITFLAVGYPSAIKIRGEGTGADGTMKVADKSIQGSLAFKLETLKTGIELRDEHMKDKYLDVSKYPTALLRITELTMATADVAKNLKDAPFKGFLTLKGVEKPVTGTVTTTGSGSDVNVKAAFPIKLSDYKIDVPTYLGITVAEDVSVQIESTAKTVSAQ